MKLTQTKLSKQEWENIEIPVSSQEKRILEFIQKSFHDVSLAESQHQTLSSFSKLDATNYDLMYFVYTSFFGTLIKSLRKKNNYTFDLKFGTGNGVGSGTSLDGNQGKKSKSKPKPIKKADQIRIDNVKTSVEEHKAEIMEYVVLELIEAMLKHHRKWRESTRSSEENYMRFHGEYYSLYSFKTNIQAYTGFNEFVFQEALHVLDMLADDINHLDILRNAELCIHQNPFEHQFRPLQLYDHQKKLFSSFSSSSTPASMNKGKLLFYIAPTGTGKTLSPIGIAEKYKVIFICAARHIGLSLAKSCISCGRKIALAFNCDDASDIRLHYAAAKEFTRHRKTGGIFRVDNSVGDNVEVMISDIKSYEYAMRYMTAFHQKENIVLFWDEPTITMDYESHEFHAQIQHNWQINEIPNVVLSSATLPDASQIPDTIRCFRERFGGVPMTILSSDNNTSIPIITKEGHKVLPHRLYNSYDDMIKGFQHIDNHSCLRRYLDISNITTFLFGSDSFDSTDGWTGFYGSLIKKGREGEGGGGSEGEDLVPRRLKVENYFYDLDSVTLANLKDYYIKFMLNLNEESWKLIQRPLHEDLGTTLMYDSTIYMVSKDAYTLSYGPTIYLAEDVEKVAKFCYQSAKIPENVLDKLSGILSQNDKVHAQMEKVNKHLEDKMSKLKENEIKNEVYPKEIRDLQRQIVKLQMTMKPAVLPSEYIPNSHDHLVRHHGFEQVRSQSWKYEHAFKSRVEEDSIVRIMRIPEVEPIWKLLLMMGVGAFMPDMPQDYVEIMKELADQQKLLLVLASSDYIYGTNYQFSHGYIGKDMGSISQEKLIQAMGRVGRQNKFGDYSLRFRDNALLEKLFTGLEITAEGQKMNQLFA